MDSSDDRPNWLPESDILLVDAMQANPRASWSQIGAALDMSAVTAARRWRRLNSAGQAWVSVAIGPQQQSNFMVGYVQISCPPESISRTAEDLSLIPEVVSLVLTTGEWNMFLIVFAPNLNSLSDLIVDRIPRGSALDRLSSSLVIEWFGGAQWRLGAMSRRQSESLRGPEASRAYHREPFDLDDRRLFIALSEDGRRSYTELADMLDRTPRWVKERIQALQRRGEIVFRCDVARNRAGWQALAFLWLKVPNEELGRIGKALAVLPESRLCASIAGNENLFFVVGLHSVSQLPSVLTQLTTQFPQVIVKRQEIGYRPVKLYGRLIDSTGNGVACVPLNLWSSTQS